MSFRCDRCKKAQPPRTKPRQVVTETRQRTYRLKNGGLSLGTEIVKTANFCDRCDDIVDRLVAA